MIEKEMCNVKCNAKKVEESRNRPDVAQRIAGVSGSHIP
jgi:hypothetical protein